MALDQATIELLERIDELQSPSNSVALQRVPMGDGDYEHRITINVPGIPTYKQDFVSAQEALDFLNSL